MAVSIEVRGHRLSPPCRPRSEQLAQIREFIQRRNSERLNARSCSTTPHDPCSS